MRLRELCIRLVHERHDPMVEAPQGKMRLSLFLRDYVDERWDNLDVGLDKEDGAAKVLLAGNKMSGAIFILQP